MQVPNEFSASEAEIIRGIAKSEGVYICATSKMDSKRSKAAATTVPFKNINYILNCISKFSSKQT